MKPSIPKGTRDFSSTEVARRNYIFNTIKHSFELFGFQPIETPSFENSSTLMGKYGEEGDRLIFKILNSGDYLKDLRNNWDRAGYLINNAHMFIGGVLFRDFNDFESEMKQGVDEFFEGFDKQQIFDFFIKRKSDLLILNKNYDSFSEGERASVRQSIFIEFFSEFINSNINDSKIVTGSISEKALRYDLTVPFARYVVQHQNEITFPFKRYQIQPVWRADRPQKGRFREFYQCDADVVGSKSLLQEVEFVQLYDTVFTNLKLEGTTIKMNNRKILSGIAEVIGAKDKLIDFTVALDKLDKIGKDGVVKEMLEKGISEDAIEKVNPLFTFTGSNEDKLDSLAEMLATSEEGTSGVEELRFVIESINKLGLQSAKLDIDVTLARGLNYYTGAIFEVSAPEGVKMGSIGGGGRYDDLTGIFGLKDVSGVGISFGLDRIYLVMEELGLFEKVELPKPKILFLNFDEAENIDKLKAIAELRKNGVKAELYPDTASSNNQQKKQWKYVDKRDIAIVISGIENGLFVVKNRVENSQENLNLEQLVTLAKYPRVSDCRGKPTARNERGFIA